MYGEKGSHFHFASIFILDFFYPKIRNYHPIHD